MGLRNRIAAGSAWLYRLFTLGPAIKVARIAPVSDVEE